MPSYTPKQVRPLRDMVLLLAEQRKNVLASGLFLPAKETGIEKVTELAGSVVRVGDSDFIKNMRLEAGQRVLFRGFLKHAIPLETDEVWEDGSPKAYFFIDAKDIMGVVSDDAHIGVFSGRPSNPHIETKNA